MWGCVYFGRFTVVLGIAWGANAWASADCSAPQSKAPVTRKSDWRLYEKLADVGLAFDELYDSPKRLPERAYFDQNRNQFILPAGLGDEKVLPPRMITAIQSHLENALRDGYADFLFYPDMGHMHLYIPDAALKLVAADEVDLNDPEILFLYHTAELIRLREGDWFLGPLVPDQWLQWRYFSRNLVGRNRPDSDVRVIFAKDEKYNTVRQLPGYREFTTLYVSANVNGCFQLQGGKPWRFDLSLTN